MLRSQAGGIFLSGISLTIFGKDIKGMWLFKPYWFKGWFKGSSRVVQGLFFLTLYNNHRLNQNKAILGL